MKPRSWIPGVIVLCVFMVNANAQQAAPAARNQIQAESSKVLDDLKSLHDQEQDLIAQIQEIRKKENPLLLRLQDVEGRMKSDREKLQQLMGVQRTSP